MSLSNTTVVVIVFSDILFLLQVVIRSAFFLTIFLLSLILSRESSLMSLQSPPLSFLLLSGSYWSIFVI